MSIEFRSRIPAAINYDDILNYGICCKGSTFPIESENYVDCYDQSGFFIPGNPLDGSIECPEDHI